MTGSFCTFSKAFSAMEALRDAGCDILPVNVAECRNCLIPVSALRRII